MTVDSREKGLPYFDLTWGRDTRLGNEILLGLSDRGPAINWIEPTSSRREWVRKFGYTYFCPDPDADTFTMKCRRCKRPLELHRADLDRRAAA